MQGKCIAATRCAPVGAPRSQVARRRSSPQHTKLAPPQGHSRQHTTKPGPVAAARLCSTTGTHSTDTDLPQEEQQIPEPFETEVDASYNTIVLRSPDDYEPLGPERFPTEPQLMNGGPGRFVIHAGGRGLVRVSVTATPAPSLIDSLFEEWEDIAEGSFTIDSEALCFDGFSGEISQLIPNPRARPRPRPVQGAGTCAQGAGPSIGTPTGHRRTNRSYGSASSSGRRSSVPHTSSSTETDSLETSFGQTTTPTRSSPRHSRNGIRSTQWSATSLRSSRSQALCGRCFSPTGKPVPSPNGTAHPDIQVICRGRRRTYRARQCWRA